MLHKAKTLKGYKLEGRDGEIGTVREFYFDDRHWAVRYLVADTGNWLTSRQVLLSPYALGAIDCEEEHIAIELTKKQIEDSPPLDSDKPVSRQFEESYYRHYGWSPYWGGSYMWGAYPYLARDSKRWSNTPRENSMNANRENPMNATQENPMNATQESPMNATQESPMNATQSEESWDPNLRSTDDVTGHHIQATDDEIGHVEDFIIDDETWAIRYLIIDTRNWWPGKKVLISPQWIESISWDESKVFVDLSRERVKQSPEYTDESLPTRDYEAGLYGHYNRQGYWIDKPADKAHSR